MSKNKLFPISGFILFLVSTLSFNSALADSLESENNENVENIQVINYSADTFPKDFVYTGRYMGSLPSKDSYNAKNPSKFQVYSKEYGWYKYSLSQVLECIKHPHRPACDIKIDYFKLDDGKKEEHTDYLIFSNVSTPKHITYDVFDHDPIHTRETWIKFTGGIRPTNIDPSCYSRSGEDLVMCPTMIPYAMATIGDTNYGVYRYATSTSSGYSHEVPGVIMIKDINTHETILTARYNCSASGHDKISTPKEVKHGEYTFKVSHECDRRNILHITIRTRTS